MVSFNLVRPSQVAQFLLVSGAIALSVALPAAVRAQSTPGNNAANQDLRPLTQSNSILSIQAGQRLMSEASSAVSAQNYDLAVNKLQLQ